MSDRQALIDWLRHWKHEVPTTREREEMIEAMRDAATALEEAQGVPREPDGQMIAAGEKRDAQAVKILGMSTASVSDLWRAMHDNWTSRHAAPTAPTREPVSAATPRDEQDAKRYRWLRDWDKHDHELFVCANRPGPDPRGAELDAEIDAALAEPKR